MSCGCFGIPRAVTPLDPRSKGQQGQAVATSPKGDTMPTPMVPQSPGDHDADETGGEHETLTPSELRLTRGCSLYPPVEAGFHDAEDRGSQSSGEDLSLVSVTDDSPKAPKVLQPPSSEGDGSAEEAEFEVLAGAPGEGIVWHAKVMTDDVRDPRFCLPSGELKPRRPMPLIKASDLHKGLRNVNGRWIFEGPLNEWPCLVRLELRSLTCCESTLGFQKLRRLWNADEGKDPPPPSKIPKRTRATFLAPSWTQVGWAADSPGFVWWFARRSSGPRSVLHGERLVEHLQDGLHGSSRATMVYVFAHRYIVEHETLRDKQTWHSGVLVEWDHGQFTTLVELAWLNGVGGYGGKCNWCEDKLSNPTELYEAMPGSMKGPWDSKRSEIRVVDMPVRSKEEFEAYLHKYSERGGLPMREQRFLDPRIYASAQVRLRFCSGVQLAGYLLNYVRRAAVYETLRNNCQTFAADLFAFLAGRPDIQPYGAIVRPVYKQRTHAFLYVPA